ncbi:MAG TPA: hypothetical protein VM677_18370 [Actinokineospora sp.]|nr:hypothetical protein [Actinokineospora sp.]
MVVVVVVGGGALDVVGVAELDDVDVVSTGTACPVSAGPPHAVMAAASAQAVARTILCRLSTAPTMPQVGAL